MADDKPVDGMTAGQKRLYEQHFGPSGLSTFLTDLQTNRAAAIAAAQDQRLGSYLVDEGEKIWDALPKPWNNPDTTLAVLDTLALPAKAAVGMGKGIGSIIKEAVTDPTPETAAEAALLVAGLGGGLPALGVGAKQARSLGMFVGRNAENADLSKLATAEKMEAKGHSREEIHDQTGWFRWQRPIVGPDGKRVIGPDGKPVTEPISDWRFEICDADSCGYVNPEVLTPTGRPKVPSFPLGKIFEHPELAKSYSGRPPGVAQLISSSTPTISAPASGVASSGAAIAAIMKQRLELSAELKALKGSGLYPTDPKYRAAYQKLQARDKELLDKYIVEYNKASVPVKETELGPVETPASAGSATSPPEWTENIFDVRKTSESYGIDTSKLKRPILEIEGRKQEGEGATYWPHADTMSFGTLPGNAPRDTWVKWDKQPIKGEYTRPLSNKQLEKNRKAAEKVFKKAGVSLDTAHGTPDRPTVHSLRHWKTDRKLSKEEQAKLFETTPEAEEAWRLVHKRENTWYEKDDLALTRFRGSALHELQHGVQAREGWQGGGDWKNFGKYGPLRYQKKLKDPFTGERLTNKEKYYRILGEIEARLAASRGDLTDAQRLERRPWTREGGLDRLESQAILEKDFKAAGGPVYGSNIQHMADGGPPKLPVAVSQEANDLITDAGINNEYNEVVSWFANEWRDGAIGSHYTEQELDNGAHYDAAITLLNEDPTFAVAEYKNAVVPEPEPRPKDSSNLPALIAKTAALSLPDEPPPKGQTGKGQLFRGVGALMRRRIFPLIQAAQLGYGHLLSPEQKAEVQDFLASPAHEFVGMDKPGIEYFKDLFGMSEDSTGLTATPASEAASALDGLETLPEINAVEDSDPVHQLSEPELEGLQRAFDEAAGGDGVLGSISIREAIDVENALQNIVLAPNGRMYIIGDALAHEGFADLMAEKAGIDFAGKLRPTRVGDLPSTALQTVLNKLNLTAVRTSLDKNLSVAVDIYGTPTSQQVKAINQIERLAKRGYGGRPGTYHATYAARARDMTSGPLPMDEASRMARAKEMGFDVDDPQFKGMYPYDWTKEVGDYKGPEITEINRTTEFPAFNKGEAGVDLSGFTASSPEVANRFAGPEGAVYPLLIKRGRELVIDAKGGFAGDVQFGESGKAFREAVKSGDYDSIRIINTKDEGDITAMITPENIRSRFAKFDPAKKDRAGLDFAHGGFVDKPLYGNNAIVGL
jgi:hypothetical protein